MVATLVALSACGARQSGGADLEPPRQAPSTSTSTSDPVALPGPDAWKSFPVDRKPRPIVLLETLPRMEGFTTDAAKRAALQANFELATTLPAAPAAVRVELPDGPAEFPTLPAEQAVAALRSQRSAKPPPNPTDALPITRVELGSVEFQTDRGRLALPSWLFHPVDALGPVAWPALPYDAFFRHLHEQPGTIPEARLAADGITLTVELPAPPAPCPGEREVRHEPVVVESATAVMVGVRAVGGPAGGCARTLELRYESHQVRLTTPLGARVLVDQNGAAGAVTPAAP